MDQTASNAEPDVAQENTDDGLSEEVEEEEIKENGGGTSNNSETRPNIPPNIGSKTITRRAHNKMVLHALKHLSSSVLGVLIGVSYKTNNKQTNIHIMDAIPLIHNYFSAMVIEVAFLQIQTWLDMQSASTATATATATAKATANAPKLRIVGVYFANANENNYSKNTSAIIIGSQLMKEYSRYGVLMAQVINSRIASAYKCNDICVDFYMNRNNGSAENAKDWKDTNVNLVCSNNSKHADDSDNRFSFLTDLSQMKQIHFNQLNLGAMVNKKMEDEIVDFEEHLDDQTKDWRNPTIV